MDSVFIFSILVMFDTLMKQDLPNVPPTRNATRQRWIASSERDAKTRARQRPIHSSFSIQVLAKDS
jgi:hypothetical protein